MKASPILDSPSGSHYTIPIVHSISRSFPYCFFAVSAAAAVLILCVNTMWGKSLPAHSGGGSVSEIVCALSEGDAQTRRDAAAALGRMGTAALASVPDILHACKDKDPHIRMNAAAVLGMMKESSAVPFLRSAMESNVDSDAHLAFSFSLAMIQHRGESSVQDLIGALRDGDRSVRERAALELGNFGSASETMVPHLIRAMKDDYPHVRAGAICTLRRLGPKAREAVPDLIMALKDKDSRVRSYSLTALEALRSR